MIPVFCGLILFYTPDMPWLRHAALAVYLLAAASDSLDGYIARHYNQHSRFGQRLDPLADKLIVNLGFVFVAANAHFQPALPLWFPVVVLARDIVIVLGSFFILRYAGRVKIAPRWTGKLTTFLQFATMVAALASVPIVPGLVAATVAFIVISFIDYVAAGTRQALHGSTA